MWFWLKRSSRSHCPTALYMDISAAALNATLVLTYSCAEMVATCAQVIGRTICMQFEGSFAANCDVMVDKVTPALHFHLWRCTALAAHLLFHLCTNAVLARQHVLKRA